LYDVFFSKKKLRPRRIEIDTATMTSESPEVAQRLSRIEDNYEQLDEIFAALESKFRSDERLAEIDRTYVEAEKQSKKRRWRSKSRSRRPRKPR
jgi:hypothetical protein